MKHVPIMELVQGILAIILGILAGASFVAISEAGWSLSTLLLSVIVLGIVGATFSKIVNLHPHG